MDEDVSPIRHTLVLRRVEPERNVARFFYALMIERDLFGRIVLVRHWGRIGTRSRERTDSQRDDDRCGQDPGEARYDEATARISGSLGASAGFQLPF
jgi:predicted DNA-binding WGR domain protein